MAEHATASPLQVLRRLDATWRGLDEAEAEVRLLRIGDNSVAAGRQPHRGSRVLTAVRNPFVMILICLTLVSAATGDLNGAAVIAAMVVISCILRVRQEYRSGVAAAALRAMVATTATVVRRASASAAPVAREVPVDQVVPGDIVQLSAGDMVPADVAAAAVGGPGGEPGRTDRRVPSHGQAGGADDRQRRRPAGGRPARLARALRSSSPPTCASWAPRW